MVTRMNKKGVFFTLVVIVIITLFLISYTFVSVANERKRIQKRVETMASFLNAIEDDMERKLFISGFRGIFVFESYLVNNPGQHIDNVTTQFTEILMNGTLYGSDDYENVTEGALWEDIESSVNTNGNTINVDITLTDYPTVLVEQEDPWNVKFTVITNLSMTDNSGLASWNKTEIIVAYVPVAGFEDPMYIFETPNFPVVIQKNTETLPLSTAQEVQTYAENSQYMNSSEAPSFIQRLEGRFDESSTCCGIESLVPVNDVGGSSGPSIADHQFFSSSPPSGGHVGGGVPSWVRLDANHCAIYYSGTCS